MQLHTLSPRRLTGIAAVSCAAALMPVAALAATGSPAAPAVPASVATSDVISDVISVDSATLLADGAAIRLVVSVTCATGPGGAVSGTITQAVGDRIAQASTQTIGFACTGESQQMSFVAEANVDGAPFRTGVAMATGSMSVTPGANTISSASTNKVLSIRS